MSSRVCGGSCGNNAKLPLKDLAVCLQCSRLEDKELICLMCAIRDHNGHAARLYVDIQAEQEKQQMAKKMAELNREMEKLDVAREKRARRLKSLLNIALQHVQKENVQRTVRKEAMDKFIRHFKRTVEKTIPRLNGQLQDILSTEAAEESVSSEEEQWPNERRERFVGDRARNGGRGAREWDDENGRESRRGGGPDRRRFERNGILRRSDNAFAGHPSYNAANQGNNTGRSRSMPRLPRNVEFSREVAYLGERSRRKRARVQSPSPPRVQSFERQFFVMPPSIVRDISRGGGRGQHTSFWFGGNRGGR